MSGIYDLTGQNIENTYQRVVQTPDGINYYDGTGSLLPLSSSFLSTASATGNTITFTKGDGSTFPITVAGGGSTYNTMTGSYGSFFDTGSYLSTSTTAIYSMSISTTDISNGVYISGSTNPYNTYIKFTNAGVYNVQFSAQFTNSGNSPQEVTIWLRKNDNSSVNDLPDTSGVVTVPASHAGVAGSAITSWNYYVNLAAGDFLQFLWNTNVANDITLATVAASLVPPVHPRIPALIVTANRIDTFLSNTGSFSGSFIGIHTGSFTGSFTGQLLGTSSIAITAYSSSIIANNSTNANYYVPFTDRTTGQSQTGSVVSQTDNVFYYNPSTNLLNVVASTAQGHYIYDTTTGTGPYYLLFSDSTGLSNNLLRSDTTGLTYNATTNTITATSSYALTASYAMNTGGGTPGGPITSIQFNSQSAFGGSADFTYQYGITGSDAYRLSLTSNYNLVVNPFSNQFPASINLTNTSNSNKQSVGLSHYQKLLAANTGATTIYSFKAINSGTKLSITGFKCDYCISLQDGTSDIVASRTGTLYGAWSNTNDVTPIITDTYINGDQIYNELGTVLFTLIWNGTNIELQMDCTNVSNGNTIFNGLFTNFGNTL